MSGTSNTKKAKQRVRVQSRRQSDRSRMWELTEEGMLFYHDNLDNLDHVDKVIN